MRDNHSAEHGQRIYGGIAHGRIVAGQGVVGIIQRHRVGHASAEHAAGASEIQAADAEGYQCHEDDRHKGDGKAETYPQQTFGAHHRLEEMFAGIQSQTGQIERQADAAKHQVGTAGGVGYESETRTEAAYQNAHDDGTSCQTELHRGADAGNGNGDGTQHQAQDDADEDGCQVGVSDRKSVV